MITAELSAFHRVGFVVLIDTIEIKNSHQSGKHKGNTMSASNPLAIAIDQSTEIYLPSRSQLDYGIHGQRVNDWIVSHERLRREATKVRRHRDEL